MQDLQKVASEHGIESRLCSGDGIERIFQLLGNNRVTKWLSTMCEESYDDETLWIQLIDFWKKIYKFSSKKC